MVDPRLPHHVSNHESVVLRAERLGWTEVAVYVAIGIVAVELVFAAFVAPGEGSFDLRDPLVLSRGLALTYFAVLVLCGTHIVMSRASSPESRPSAKLAYRLGIALIVLCAMGAAWTASAALVAALKISAVWTVPLTALLLAPLFVFAAVVLAIAWLVIRYIELESAVFYRILGGDFIRQAKAARLPAGRFPATEAAIESLRVVLGRSISRDVYVADVEGVNALVAPRIPHRLRRTRPILVVTRRFAEALTMEEQLAALLSLEMRADTTNLYLPWLRSDLQAVESLHNPAGLCSALSKAAEAGHAAKGFASTGVTPWIPDGVVDGMDPAESLLRRIRSVEEVGGLAAM